MKRLLTLLLLLAPSVLAQNPVSGGPIPQSTYQTPSTIGGGLPAGCTSPATGWISCTGSGQLYFNAAAYGVLADAQINWAPAWTNASNVVTCATCNFTTTAKVG